MRPAEGISEILSSRTRISVLWKGRLLQLFCTSLMKEVLKDILWHQPGSSMITLYYSLLSNIVASPRKLTMSCCHFKVGCFHLNCLTEFWGSNHLPWYNTKLQPLCFKIIIKKGIWIVRSMFFNSCTFFLLKPKMLAHIFRCQ